jgi:predicted nucleic acid-binding protein
MKPVLVDSGFIVALLDRSERNLRRCVEVGDSLVEPLITCKAVIAESCHLLRGIDGASQAILENVAKGIIQVTFAMSDRATEVARLMKKYADVPMDLADACLVDLATETGTGRILTLDSDFRFYRWGRNRQFEILLDVD